MENKVFIGYKIHWAYFLHYRAAIDEKIMMEFEENNQIIASSRIYLICKVKRKGFFKKKISEPEVLYVGETFNKRKRFSTHKKLLEATTLLKRHETIWIYFLNIRHSFVSINPTYNPLNLYEELKDQESKTSIKLLERFFIKLFRPPLNKLHNNNKLNDDDLIVDKLIKHNINYVHLDIGMTDHLFNFLGGLRDKDQDWYTYDLLKEKIDIGDLALETLYA